MPPLPALGSRPPASAGGWVGGEAPKPAGLQHQQSFAASTSSAIVIKLIAELQKELSTAIDAFVRTHSVPGASKAPMAEDSLAAWRAFPRSEPFYQRQLKRLADIARIGECEQIVTDLMLR